MRLMKELILPDLRDSFALSLPQLVRSRSERIKRSNASWRAFKACKTAFKHASSSTRKQSHASSKRLVDLYEAHLEARLREVHEQYTLARTALSDAVLPSRMLGQVAAYRSIHHRAMYKLMAKLSQLKKRKIALAESLINLDSGSVESWIQSFLADPSQKSRIKVKMEPAKRTDTGGVPRTAKTRSSGNVRTLAIHRLAHGKEQEGYRKLNGERWPTYKQFWCPFSQRCFSKITSAQIVPTRLSQDVLAALVGRGYDLQGPENCFPMATAWEENWARNKFALVQIDGTGTAYNTPEEYKLVVLDKGLLDRHAERIGEQKTWRQYDGMRIQFLADERPSKVLMYVRYVMQMFWCREQGRRYDWLFGEEGRGVRWKADEQVLRGRFVGDAAWWMRDLTILDLLEKGVSDDVERQEEEAGTPFGMSDEDVFTDELLLDFHMAKTPSVIVYDGFADVNTLVDVQY